jgi:hypothetical protein
MLPLMSRSNLEFVEQTLQRMPTDGSAQTCDDNLTLVASLGQPASALRMIETLVTDPTALGTVAGRSYRHVNHFDKIVLVDSPDPGAYRLTLHIWNPPYGEAELRNELIHDHRFSFWSCVLTGNLVSENYELSEAGTRFREYQYCPEDRTSTSFYHFAGERMLAPTSLSRKKAGESYHLGYDRIHRVVLPQEHLLCTLVLRGPRRREFSSVFNTVYPREDAVVEHSMFSETEVSSRLHQLTTACSARLTAATDAR